MARLRDMFKRKKPKTARPIGTTWWERRGLTAGNIYEFMLQDTKNKKRAIGVVAGPDGWGAYYKRKFFGRYKTIARAKARVERIHKKQG